MEVKRVLSQTDMLNCNQMSRRGPSLKELLAVRQTARNEARDQLTALPSVQFCTPVRRHEVAGRWRDTWQRCAWERSPCRVVPPDHCKDQLQQRHKPDKTIRNRRHSSGHAVHRSSRLTGRWPCLLRDYFPGGCRWLHTQFDQNSVTQDTLEHVKSTCTQCKAQEPKIILCFSVQRWTMELKQKREVRQ